MMASGAISGRSGERLETICGPEARRRSNGQVTLDARFERRVVVEMERLEQAAHWRSRPRRNDHMPLNDAAPAPKTHGPHPRLDRLRRGALPLPAPRPLNPALLKDAEQRADNLQNRIADRITAFSGSMAFVYLHVIWFACWIGFGVEKYPFGLLTMIVSLEAIFLSTFVMISQNRADAKRQVLADEQWKTVQEEDKQNEELLDLSKQILDLTKQVHASDRSTSGPASSTSTSSDGAK
jgi:low affinity Fe/Cu permease